MQPIAVGATVGRRGRGSMKTVWKFTIGITGEQLLNVPEAAQFIAARQRGKTIDLLAETIDLWAEVDTEAPIVERRVRVHGTGHPQESGFDYIGTTFDDSAGLVWHVYIDQRS